MIKLLKLNTFYYFFIFDQFGIGNIHVIYVIYKCIVYYLYITLYLTLKPKRQVILLCPSGDILPIEQNLIVISEQKIRTGLLISSLSIT